MSKRICVFGASITKGHNDEEKGGWVNRLGLSLLKSNEEYTVYNLGISGDSSSDLLKRFKVECEARGPKIILIAIGNNDSSFWKTKNENLVLAKDYENNLNKLLKLGKKYTTQIILVGLTGVIESLVNPVPWDENIYYYNKDIVEYNLILKKVANENKLLFISMDDVLDETDFDDGLHPNASGHKKMFEQVRNFLYINKVLV